MIAIDGSPQTYHIWTRYRPFFIFVSFDAPKLGVRSFCGPFLARHNGSMSVKFISKSTEFLQHRFQLSIVLFCLDLSCFQLCDAAGV
jgi:hypothetical protein